MDLRHIRSFKFPFISIHNSFFFRPLCVYHWINFSVFTDFFIILYNTYRLINILSSGQPHWCSWNNCYLYWNKTLTETNLTFNNHEIHRNEDGVSNMITEDLYPDHLFMSKDHNSSHSITHPLVILDDFTPHFNWRSITHVFGVRGHLNIHFSEGFS